VATHLPHELISMGPSTLAPGGARSGEWIEVEYNETSRRTIREYLWVLYKYRWLGAVCFATVLGIALLVTLMADRVYTASTRLLVSREASMKLQLKEDILNLDDPDLNAGGASSFLATQVAVLKSRDLAERVIRKQHLAANDAFLHPGADRQGLVAIAARLLGTVRPRGLSSERTVAPDEEGSSVSEIPPQLLDRYLGYLHVQDVRGTDLIEVSFTTPSPSLSALLAAAHTQAYLEAAEETRIATDVEANQFLDRQLRQSREQVDRTEADLSTFATANPNVAVNQEQKVIGQRIAQASQAFSDAEAQRIAMQSRFEFLSREELDPLPYFLGSDAQDPQAQGIQKLHLALIDVGIQKSTLAERLGPNHPQMVELSRQAAEIKQQLRLELGREVAAVKDRFDAAAMREAGMRNKLDELERSAIELQGLGARYDRLQTDVRNARALHDSLLKQQIQTAVHSDLGASNVRIVERAEVPQGPSRPNVPFNLAFGAIAGLLVAVGAVVACERFDNSVKTSKEIEGLLNLPPLAIIRNFAIARRSGRRGARRPELPAGPVGEAVRAAEVAAGPRPSPELIVFHEPWSVVTEAFRSLRTSVLFSTPEAPPKVLLVTSAGMGEGKTIISTNLAATLAESGSRVLLIDGDMRHPSCHPNLGVDNERGLSSFLTGQLALEEVMHALEQPRLWFVAAGPTPPNPAELLGSARMRDAIASLREQFDFIIVDSPPVIPVTDGVVLSREVDGVVLVVKGHDTPREMVRRARDSLQLANAHILGVVINNVDFGWGDFFHYDQYYGYYAQPSAHENTEARA
jgi:succinoglycan biosynthesis transport protein ExoP